MQKYPFSPKESEFYHFEGLVFISACCGPDAVLVDRIRIVTWCNMISALMALSGRDRNNIRKHTNQ